MDARRIIAEIRDGQSPSRDELIWFARGLASGDVSDAQAGAFAMAVVLNGLGDEGRVGLTEAMRDSGEVLRWDLPGPAIDKHSTGGVGDCVSLLLAPMLAARGAYVPMISGRGLGHTGGTLDKLEAIPGVTTDVSEARFRRIVKDAGAAIVSATGDIAPADKRLYAVRDVTATVESIDLITASILSKKLAAGLDTLILDVKVGTGAFMATPDDARALAKALVGTANDAGCRTSALITDMNQSLAPAAGNALEIAVVMDALTGGTEGRRLIDLSVELAADLLVASGLEADPAKARQALRQTLSSGAAAERFDRMIAGLGGPSDLSQTWRQRLPEATVIREVTAPAAGYLAGSDAHALGMAVVDLGGGRRRDGDQIDPSVGLSDILPLGAKVSRGTPIARIHARTEDDADAAEQAVLGAFAISAEHPEPQPLIHERIEG